jgi:hypothetical protein
MKKALFMVTLCVALLGFAIQAAAAVYPTIKVPQYFAKDAQNRMLVCFNSDCTDSWTVAYTMHKIPDGEGFPAGTDVSLKNNRILYRVPGGQWTEITNDQIVATSSPGTPSAPATSTQPGGNITRITETEPIRSSEAGVFPSTTQMKGPYAIIPNFQTGTNIIDLSDPQMKKELYKVRDGLSASINDFVILVGVASKDKNSWTCYFTKDYTYFRQESLYDGRPNVEKKTGADVCNEALAYSRAKATADWLIANGADPTRVFAVKYATYGNFNGSQLADPKLGNQAAVALMITKDKLKVTEFDDSVIRQPEPKDCPTCDPVETDYILPANCGVAERRIGNKITINIVCVVEPQIINCPDCPQQSVVPEPEPKQCPWYYQWPCMSRGEKLLTGTLVTGAVVAIICTTVKGGEGANGAGDGGSICKF